MVHSARSLGGRVGLGDVVLGAIILSGLTGIPNLVAALRLAHKHRGAVVISEAFNSNTLTLAIGIILPVCLLGHQAVGAPIKVAVYWLAVMTTGAVGLTLRRNGLRRLEELVLVLAYASFVVTIAVLVGTGSR